MRWLTRTVCMLALVGGMLQPVVVQAAAPAQVTVSVRLPDGSPAAHATIFLNDTQVEADATGRW